MRSTINDVDVVLLSGNMTDIYFDMDYYEYSEKKIDSELLINELKKSIAGENLLEYKWFDMRDNNYNSRKTILSSSAFESNRGKGYIVGAHIENQIISEDYFAGKTSQNEWSLLYHEFLELKKILRIESVEFCDAKIKIGCLGDVSFSCRICIRNADITIVEYTKVGESLRKIARSVYKDGLAEMCCNYINVVSDLNIKDAKKFRLFRIELEGYDSKKQKCDFVKKRSLHSISWLHVIHNTELYESSSLRDDLNGLIENEDDVREFQLLSFANAKVSIGWSHSLVITNLIDETERQDIVEFYSTPIEMEWAEWEFMMKLIKNIDRLMFSSFEIFETKKNRFHRTKKYKNDIDKLYFFITRIIDSFDSTIVTLNRTQSKVLSIQRNNWDLLVYRDKYEQKSDSLKNIVDYIAQAKKTKQSNLLNGILFLIAILSTIDISNSIYEMFVNGIGDQFFISFTPITTIFLVIFLYSRISKE